MVNECVINSVVSFDAAEKTRNMGAQLQSSGVQWPQSYLGKFTSCMTFGAHKLVRSEPFLDLLLALYSDVRKFFCRPTCAHLRSRP